VTALIIFAKAPVPGLVKTRLIPALGVAGATQLYQRMLEKIVATACQSDFSCVELYCTPDTRHPVFQSLQTEHPITLRVQQGADLGLRMYQAMDHALSNFTKVVLIGCDCPQIKVADLFAAQASLTQHCPLVLGPAADGGYVLIGARKLDVRLFTDIPWGTEQVLDITRQRISELDWGYREIRQFNDIDRPEDLQYLPQW